MMPPAFVAILVAFSLLLGYALGRRLDEIARERVRGAIASSVAAVALAHEGGRPIPILTCYTCARIIESNTGRVFLPHLGWTLRADGPPLLSPDVMREVCPACWVKTQDAILALVSPVGDGLARVAPVDTNLGPARAHLPLPITGSPREISATKPFSISIPMPPVPCEVCGAPIKAMTEVTHGGKAFHFLLCDDCLDQQRRAVKLDGDDEGTA